MNLPHHFQSACLLCVLILVSACNKKNDNQENTALPQVERSRSTGLDFNFPIELELKLVTKDVVAAVELCKVDGLKPYECKVTVSGQGDAIQHGQVSVKTKAIFTQKEFDTLISSIKEKYHTEGEFSYSMAQKKTFDVSPN